MNWYQLSISPFLSPWAQKWIFNVLAFLKLQKVTRIRPSVKKLFPQFRPIK